jgi:hypothetical protein
MRHIDPHSDLADGIEPAPPPDRRPDGTVIIPPQRTEVPPRPSLCEAGPCRHYHRFSTQVDAANPRAVRLAVAPPEGVPRTERGPHGAVYQPPAVYHVEFHHYCYPNPGIEMNLGSLPVPECNRWDPDVRAFVNVPPGPNRMNVPSELGTREGRRAFFHASQTGQAFARSVQDWELARSTLAEEAAEAERLMAGALEDASERVACQFCGLLYRRNDLDSNSVCSNCETRAYVPSDKDPTP